MSCAPAVLCAGRVVCRRDGRRDRVTPRLFHNILYENGGENVLYIFLNKTKVLEQLRQYFK